jgi:Na+-translocating ferredoxin:NAD+ oxidoreductase subunit E
MAVENASNLRQFVDGVIKNNPTLVQLLGMCPTLAVTNSVDNALVMGAAVIFVLVMSNLVTSGLRHVIQPHVRILVFTLTIATFVTIADLVLKAYVFEVSKKLGPFVPLIIVNCIIIARAEVVASKSGLRRSLADALGCGLGFTLGLTALGLIREVLGSGSITLPGWKIPLVDPKAFEPHAWVIMIMPPGAFLTLGAIIGIITQLRMRTAKEGA